MNIKRMLSLILSLVLILTAGAAGAISANEESPSDQGLPQEAELMAASRVPVIAGVVYSLADVSPLDAFDIFMSMYAGAKVTEVKFETKKDKLQYKVEGYDDSNEYEIRIDGVTGEVIKDKTKKLDKKDKDDGIITREDIAKVNELIMKAMDRAGGNLKFKKWEVEEDDGILEFEIEFKNEKDKDVEYTYNLRSGELIEIDD